MSTTTTTTSRIEDYILLLGVALGAAAQYITPNTTIFGMPPLLFGAILGSIGKGLAGLHDYKSYEDWIIVVSTTLGAFSTAISKDPQYAVYGLVIGQIGKAVVGFIGVNRSNVVEDALLFAFAVLTAVGQGFNQPTILNLALFLAAMAKALPSLGLSGATTITTTTNTPPKPAPAPAPTPAPTPTPSPTA